MSDSHAEIRSIEEILCGLAATGYAVSASVFKLRRVIRLDESSQPLSLQADQSTVLTFKLPDTSLA
jgi:hypothetical protein